MPLEAEDLILQMGRQAEGRKDFAKARSKAHAFRLPGRAAFRLIPDHAPGHAHSAHKHIRGRKPFVPRPRTLHLLPIPLRYDFVAEL